MDDVAYTVNRRSYGSLFHYAHFLCDCLFPEFLHGLQTRRTVVREKSLKQTLGKFALIYEEVMQCTCVELCTVEFQKHSKNHQIIQGFKAHRDLSSMLSFRAFVFQRLGFVERLGATSHKSVLLIKRGCRQDLISDKRLAAQNKNVTCGRERREIVNVCEIEDKLSQALGDSFRAECLEELPFKEQVSLFMWADVVVLAHGAAMANLFFCRAGTSVLEVLCDKSYKDFNTICEVLQLKHLKIKGFHLDVAWLLEFLSTGPVVAL